MTERRGGEGTWIADVMPGLNPDLHPSQAYPGASPVTPLVEPPRERWQDDQSVLLGMIGFGVKECRGADVGHPLADAKAEAQLQVFLGDLWGHIARGAWLYLLGGMGIGKSMTMARIALSVPLHSLVLTDGEWPAGPKYTQPAGTLNPDDIAYRFAPDMAPDFGDYAAEGAVSAALHMARKRPIVMVDDVHRWLELGGYVRDNVLAGWDSYTEQRDGHGLTVVSLNLFEENMERVPQFKLGLDRARERGLILEIRGESERGQQKTD